MTLVDRHTRCILGWEVDAWRTEATLQALVDAAPQAGFYYSDWVAVYRALLYTPGIHTPVPNKGETYGVEGDNAELRHYLAWLARKSRCFPRAFTPCVVPSVYSSFFGTLVSCIANAFRLTPPTSSIFYLHLFRHSQLASYTPHLRPNHSRTSQIVRQN